MEILIAAVLVALVVVVGMREYAATDTASDLARVKRDFYVLASAMEAYSIDTNSYPATTGTFFDSVDYGSDYSACRTFRRRPAYGYLMTLTTPIAYLSAYPVDPFADRAGVTYRAWTPNFRGWILGSFGPDRDEALGGQLEWDSPFNTGMGAVETVYTKFLPQPSQTLLCGGGYGTGGGAYTYDPTNGVVSNGDLWRVRFEDHLRPKDTSGVLLY